ncbi:MAG: radical SAM protein [Candidatus Micrarchaeia archaeon]
MFFDFIKIGKGTPFKNEDSNVDEEIYSIGKIGSLYVLYAPLSGRLCVCDDEFRRFLVKNKKLGKNAEHHTDFSQLFPRADGKFRLLGLFLTSKCNLRCTYCYAKGGEIEKTMSFETAKKAIDFMNENFHSPFILFHGGGEPTIEFKLMKKVVEYARELSSDTKFNLQTNGIFSNEVREWLLKNMDLISISCDGPPDIQDTQRPLANGDRSSPILERNIRYFIKNSKGIKVQAVITEFSVARQAEIVEYFHKLGIKEFSFIPVKKMGRCVNCNLPYSTAPTSHSFSANFLKALELADFYEMPLSTRTVAETCGNKPCLLAESFFVTPDNFLSPCLAVNSADSPFKELLYGSIKVNVEIYKEKSDLLNKRLVHNIPTCNNCFLKWNCSGGCPISACLIYGRDIFSPHKKFCNEQKKIMRELFLYRAQKDLVKLKPLLKSRNGKLFYSGLSDEFEANIQTISSKTDVDSLARKIIFTKPGLVLLSFKLGEKDLDTKFGEKILSFLQTLKSNYIYFKVIKPLPRCLFNQDYETIVKEFKLPRNCEDCLELFVLYGSSYRLCNARVRVPLNEVINRKQLYAYFEKFNKRVVPTHCQECIYRMRKKCNGLC